MNPNMPVDRQDEMEGSLEDGELTEEEKDEQFNDMMR